MQPTNPWHTLTAREVVAELQTTCDGLTTEQASQRLAETGVNELPAADHVSPWSILFRQFKNVLIIILLIATVISVFLGHVAEAVAIVVIVLFATLLGFAQEYRAERAIEALHRMAAPTATVVRDGSESSIPARDLVPGDVIVLSTGDKVPADARLLEVANLQVDEAALTGESVPVEKHAAALAEAGLAVAERNNMAYSGTVATYGRGRAVVVATGLHTEFGKITGMLTSITPGKTPLQANLDRVGRMLGIAALAVVVMIVLAGLVRGAPLLEMLIFGIALAVAVVPEALPAVVTISLALGVRRMVRRHALIKRLPIVETLGSTSVICADKTGTLTKDEMTVREIWVDGGVVQVTGAGYVPEGGFYVGDQTLTEDTVLCEALRAAVLASDAKLLHADGRFSVNGDPTEGALVVAAAKHGIDKDALEHQCPRIAEIPFTSESKRMTTLHTVGGSGTMAYAKGAPEVILKACRTVQTKTGPKALSEQTVQTARDVAEEMARKALRVIAVAHKPVTGIDDAQQDMVLLGLFGMIDPPRPEAKDAIRTCEDAGIKPIMITGDHPATAAAVARELGILRTGRVVTGTELDALSDHDLAKTVAEIEVYARVSPEHKLRVIDAWQAQERVVAMTGDGVNDAPALRKADVGVAMGVTGTDVSKEAADMTLTDDNFASIVGAIEEGRGIFGNIKKYLMYLLSSNIGEVGLIAGATLAGLPLPLTAVQILYVNLATDGLPALALSVDPPEPGLMRRPPRDPRAGIFTRRVVTLTVVGGLWSTAVNIALFKWALDSGRPLIQAMAMTFVALVLIQFFKAYSFRSENDSVLRGLLANRWLNLAILWELALLLVIVYVPVLQKPFGTFDLAVHDWLIVTGVAFTVVPVLEIAKWITRRHGAVQGRGNVADPASAGRHTEPPESRDGV